MHEPPRCVRMGPTRYHPLPKSMEVQRYLTAKVTAGLTNAR